jgi:hypothetical protein
MTVTKSLEAITQYLSSRHCKYSMTSVDTRTLLAYAVSHNTPSTHVLYKKDGHEGFTTIDILLASSNKGPAKGKKATLKSFIDDIKTNYIYESLLPAFHLWFADKTKGNLSHDVYEKVFESFKPFEDELPTSAVDGKSYSVIVLAFIASSRETEKKDREKYLLLNAIKDLENVVVPKAVLDSIYDFEPSSWTSRSIVQGNITAQVLFETITLNESLPFVIYTPELGEMQIKIHKSGSIFAQEYLRLLSGLDSSGTQISVDLRQPNTVVGISIYVNEDTPYTFTYKESTKAIELEIPVSRHTDRMQLEKNILKHFNVVTDTSVLVQVKGSFVVMNLEYSKELLLYLLDTDPRFTPLFYLNEFSRPFPQKTRFTLVYNAGTLGEVGMISFGPSTYTKVSDIFFKDGAIKKSIDVPYVRIGFSRASSIQAAHSARDSFAKLLTIYNETEEKNSEVFEMLFNTSLLRYTHTKIKKAKTKLQTLQTLQLNAPNTFMRQGRAYQGPSQVTVVTTVELASTIPAEKEKLEAAKKEKIRLRDVQGQPVYIKRQILLYEGVYYTSPIADRPYLGIKNTKSTRGIPVPHCYADPKIKINPDTCQPEPLSVEPTQVGGGTSSKPLVTLKILVPNAYGFLPSALTAFFKHFGADIDAKDGFLRVGVPYTLNGLFKPSPNGILHAVCKAAEMVEYTIAPDKEAFVNDIRHNILPQFAVAARQELYDLNTKEIISALKSDTWLDPLKYYRIVEEWLREKLRTTIRLFFFGFPEGSLEPSILMPRHSLFHARSYLETVSVMCFFVNNGSESDNAIYPQLEPVVAATKEKGRKLTFSIFNKENGGSVLITRLQSNLLEALSVNRVSLDHGPSGVATHSVIHNPQDVPGIADSLKGFKIISQQIDAHGKARAFMLENGVVVTTPPMAPTRVEEVFHIHGRRRTIQQALAIVKKLEARPYISVSDGMAVGVYWYKGRTIDPFLILVEHVPYSVKFGEQTDLPVPFGRGTSVLDKLQRLKEAVPRILAVVEREAFDTKDSGANVVGRVCTVIEGYEYLDPKAPITEDGLYVLDSERLRAYLIRYVDEYLAKERQIPASLISRPNVPVGNDVVTIPSENAFNSWLSSLTTSERNIVHKGLNVDVINDQPYVIENLGTLYMLQRVRDDDVNRAITCGYNWLRYKVNTGIGTIPKDVKWHQGSTRILQLENNSLETVSYAHPTEAIKGLVTIVEVVHLPRLPGDKDLSSRWAALLYIGDAQ